MNSQYIKMQAAIILSVLCVWAGNAFGQQETPQQIVNRASLAYHDKWKGSTIKDYVGSGQITITGNPNSPLNFVLMVKENKKVKLQVTNPDGSKVFMTDGKNDTTNWHASGLFSGNATGVASHFIDSQTLRSIARLFDSDNALTDKGPADPNHAPESASSRVIESSKNGVVTRYYIDNTTSLITRIEFNTGASYSMLLNQGQYPAMASFVFSNYQSVNDIL